MFPNVPLSIGRKRVFDSVFPQAPLKNITSTPEAAPVLGFTGSSESASGVRKGTKQRQTPPESSDPDSVPEQVLWDRARHNATAYLSVPDKVIGVGNYDDSANGQKEKSLLEPWTKKPPSQEVWNSLIYVGSDSSQGRLLRAGSKEHDLKEWYTNEVRRHFVANFKDVLLKTIKDGDLRLVVQHLRLAQCIYYTPFIKYITPMTDLEDQESSFAQLRRSFHAIVTYSLPSADISYLLAEELVSDGLTILGIYNDEEDEHLSAIDEAADAGDNGMEVDQKYSTSYKKWKAEPSPERRLCMMTECEDTKVTEARQRLLRLLEGLQDVGLGGVNGQKIFADVMNNLLTEFIATTYAGQWESPSLVSEHLRQWTENVFARMAVQVLHIFKTTEAENAAVDHLDVTLKDVESWHNLGLARVGSLRINELFDIIVEWDSSSGAIEDLKYYTTGPASRFYLTNSFTTLLVQRLLQPGASTIEILQIYISIIRAFTQLDPRGVLLDRVARPIRRYLKDREDTVKVIVGGLLADPVDADGQTISSHPDTLVELAAELTKAHELSLQDDSGELDWDDMNWMPDPVDAAPDYKKSKHSDVIGSLISLFESKETFVKELQKVLTERLLKKNKDYELEISVLELLKVRFGDSALQACEVMLRDVLDSKRVDSVIRTDQKMGTKQSFADVATPPGVVVDEPELHAKILSRFFWPSLQEQTFKVPDEISSLQARYSKGFESLKQSRKLTWLNSLGHVTVELDLEDRVFKDEVTTWQATIIYAFQSPSSTPTANNPITKSVSELSQQLQMPVSLARSACLFWFSKRILTQPTPDTFRVLEVLPEETDPDNNPTDKTSPTKSSTQARRQPAPSATSDAVAAASAAAEAAEAAAAKETADAAAMAKMDIYWQFIVGMLTNQGAMPLQRIIMMLKIAVPGGFPFSSEELREFLGRMVVGGKLEVVSGGSYKIVSS